MENIFDGLGALSLIIMVLVGIICIAGFWKVFEKAGKPGWAAIIPIYNTIVLLEIIEKPIWWFLLLLIPFVNFIIAIILYIELAKKFGQGTAFGLGMVFLPIIFIPILGFGDAQYQGETV